MSEPPFRIAAVGDLQLGDSPTCVGFGFASRCGDDAGQLIDLMSDLTAHLRAADIAFGNLETPLSRRGLERGSWRSRQLRGYSSYAQALRKSGFNVVNVANNHASQHGVEAFRDTVGSLQDAGISVCGLPGDGPWASLPLTPSVAAGRVGILGYCLRSRQYHSEDPPYAEATPSQIRADVARLRALIDVVVVSLHWGEEFVTLPSQDEVTFARSLVDSGASFVVGHHPHVLRPVEAYRDGIIAYSLGNCIGDMVWYTPFRAGLLMTAEVTDAQPDNVMIREIRLGAGFRPGLTGRTLAVVPSLALHSLSRREYAQAVTRTWRRQRAAVYLYTFIRLWRFPPTLLMQLLWRTLRNKLDGLTSGIVRRRTPV